VAVAGPADSSVRVHPASSTTAVLPRRSAEAGDHLVQSPEAVVAKAPRAGAAVLELGVDLLALIMAGFVGIPLAILGVCLALIGILFFAAVGMAVTGIGLLTLPVLAILLIPGAIALLVEARRARDGDELHSTRSPLPPHRQVAAATDVRRIGLQRQRACR
jgi:hypothetical protein